MLEIGMQCVKQININSYYISNLKYFYISRVSVRVMVFNVTFNNISVISWRSILLVEETGVPVENHQPAASHWQTLSYNVASNTCERFKLTTLVVIGTDFIGNYKSNFHTIMTTTAPLHFAGIIKKISPIGIAIKTHQSKIYSRVRL